MHGYISFQIGTRLNYFSSMNLQQMNVLAIENMVGHRLEKRQSSINLSSGIYYSMIGRDDIEMKEMTMMYGANLLLVVLMVFVVSDGARALVVLALNDWYKNSFVYFEMD